MKTIHALLCIAALSLAPRPSQAAERLCAHCSPDGDDNGPGTFERPLKTLAAARDRIRAARRERGSLPEGGAAILLRGGRYAVSETLELTREDSGEEGRPLLIAACDGERPVLDGAAPATGWRRHDGDILVADVRTLLPDEPQRLAPWGYGIQDDGFAYPDLYENGRAMELARHPNAGYAKILSIDVTNRLISTELGDLSAWRGEHDVLAQGYWKNYWSDRVVRVTEILPADGAFRIDLPALGTRPRVGRRCRLVNALAALDEPGEWYFDRTNRLIYAWPRGPRPVFAISRHEKAFIALKGVSNVVLRGIVFEGGRGGAVSMEDCSDTVFEGNVVRNFGRSGVHASGRRLLFADNVFHTFGGGALSVKGGSRKTLEASEIVVRNNEFSDIERRWRTYRPAVHADGVGITIARNHFHDAPSSAIRLEGNDHLVASNLVEDCVLESDDQGAIDIYANPTYAGNRIIGNVWRRIGRGGPMMHAGQAAVRLDDFISGVEISGNRFVDCGHWKVFGAVQINGGRHNTVVSNLFEKCRKNVSNQKRSDAKWRARLSDTSCRVGRNLAAAHVDRPPYSERYPDLKNILDWRGNTITNNWTGPLPYVPHPVPQDADAGPVRTALLETARRNDGAAYPPAGACDSRL